ncbi:MAG: hypothetical protein HY897_03165 [Deltaproteobacteria bacterium]|nr:hypothetical protein [Deltaproteobacteria bacterium]
MPFPELRNRGFNVLVKELGPANALRFLDLYQAGSGNYTEERDRLLGNMTVEQIAEEIKKLRQEGKL